jgi:hypothetical protein
MEDKVMSKLKTTKKAMSNEYNKIIKIGYCDAQYLLKFENEFAYSTRAEGWACDYYDIGGVLISTGYAPLADKNAKHDYETTKKYEDKAREIVCDYKIPYDEQEKQVKTLLDEFIYNCVKQ